MIDLESENLMPLRDVPGWLADRNIRPRGKPITVRSVQSWVARGFLETTPRHLFGVRYTSAEALQRMVERVQADRPGHGRDDRPARRRGVETKGHARAMRELKEKGLV